MEFITCFDFFLMRKIRVFEKENVDNKKNKECAM